MIQTIKISSSRAVVVEHIPTSNYQHPLLQEYLKLDQMHRSQMTEEQIKRKEELALSDQLISKVPTFQQIRIVPMVDTEPTIITVLQESDVKALVIMLEQIKIETAKETLPLSEMVIDYYN
jgi:bisphosphoglycerate-dependent phosphoglycerate mutase